MKLSWCAGVSDHSQSSAPKQTTAYSASAICRFWIVSHRGPLIESFAEAKRVAIDLVLQQKQASADPECRSDFTAKEKS